MNIDKTIIDLSKRTKGEWIIRGSSIGSVGTEKIMAAMTYPIDEFGNNTEESEANAAFICLAVNNHDKLIEAINRLIHSYEFHCLDAKNDSNAIKLAKELLNTIQKENEL